jgi:hypothetical protein
VPDRAAVSRKADPVREHFPKDERGVTTWVWMRKPVPLLDDDKPLDVIAAGDYRRVSRVVAGLESSGAA